MTKIPPQEGPVSFLECNEFFVFFQRKTSLVTSKDEHIKEMNHFPVFISESPLRSPLLNLSFSNV